MRFIMSALAVSSLIGAALPVADPLARQLIADSHAVTETSFGFERTTRAEATDGKESEKEVEVDRFDPAANPRYRLISVDNKLPKSNKFKEYAKAIEGKPVPNYGRVALLLAVAHRTDATHFHVDDVPKEVLPGQGGMMARHLKADLTVDTSGAKPFVAETRMFAPAPFRMMLIAKVDRFEVVNRYHPGPDGRPRIVSQDVTISGSGPGMSGTQITHAVFRPL